ncbi:MAG: GNAT family N-acetyltransferase [Bacteroidota bacterium]
MIEVRKVVGEEVETLSALATRTFSDTFAEHNTLENMHAYIPSAFSVAQLSQELASPDSETYFVLVDEKPVGYIQLNFSSTEKGLEDFSTIEICRLYILQEFLGHKFGKALMEKAVAIAEERHAEYLWLGVWEHNYRAVEFYKKWGFEFFGSHVFQLGSDPQIDLLMKRPITTKSQLYED